VRGCEEVVTAEDLTDVLGSREQPHAYIGFEPSGLVHIGTGLICLRKLNELVEAGVHVTVLFADWHAWINDKLDGTLESIKFCGEYMRECFQALGASAAIEYVYASELVSSAAYWALVLRIAKSVSLQRIRRAMTIMGRADEEHVPDAAKYFYPPMQVADIFALDVDIALGGMDQRRAHMLAREVAESVGYEKPVALHLPILPSLRGGERMEQKMSKSLPESCIFVHDSEEAIERKIRAAYCPEGVLADNPVLAICKDIIFRARDKLEIERERKFGGDIVLGAEELFELYQKRELHPLDLKRAVARELSELLRPVRAHFAREPARLENMLKIMGIEK
jgi:tyrosyl-tRNA synthetase